MNYGNTDDERNVAYENDLHPLGDVDAHGNQGFDQGLYDDFSTRVETRRRQLSWDLPAAFFAPRDHTSLGRTPAGEFFLHD